MGIKMKTLDNVDTESAKRNTPDIKVVGGCDMWTLLCKAFSKSEGWTKSTKAMDIPGGAIVQVTTQQRNPDGSYAVAEALTFVPGVLVLPDGKGGNRLASMIG